MWNAKVFSSDDHMQVCVVFMTFYMMLHRHSNCFNCYCCHLCFIGCIILLFANFFLSLLQCFGVHAIMNGIGFTLIIRLFAVCLKSALFMFSIQIRCVIVLTLSCLEFPLKCLLDRDLHIIANHQGVISTLKHKIFGKMTPSCILQDFLYLFESKEILQKFHSYKTIGTLNDIENHILFC